MSDCGASEAMPREVRWRFETKVEDGKLHVSGSAAITDEELRELLKRLCQAHAQLTGWRGPHDEPLFVSQGGGASFTAQAAGGGVNFMLLSPLFGWVGMNTTLDSLFRTIGDLATDAADIIDAGKAAKDATPRH